MLFLVGWGYMDFRKGGKNEIKEFYSGAAGGFNPFQ